MEIELRYDAAAQETDIKIDGIPVNKNDVYGFLRPVRNFPIQSWLSPIGSWNGLEQQITDLARGEKTEIKFYGRKCDCEDLCKCLEGNKMISIEFAEWDTAAIYDKLSADLTTVVKSNHKVMKEMYLAVSPDGKIELPNVSKILGEEPKWAYDIYSDEDREIAAEAKDKRCCFVHSSYFTSYDKLDGLLQLTRSLRLPADAVYCCFDSKDAMNDRLY